MIELLIACGTGFISSVCTIAVLKTDINWIKETIIAHDNRITFLERNI